MKKRPGFQKPGRLLLFSVYDCSVHDGHGAVQKGVNVIQRILFENGKMRFLARSYGTKGLLYAQKFCRVDGSALDGFHGSHSVFHHQDSFHGCFVIGIERGAGICSQCDFYSGFMRPAESILMGIDGFSTLRTMKSGIPAAVPFSLIQ